MICFTPGSHPKFPTHGPTLGFHHMVLPQDPTPGSWVLGPTPGSWSDFSGIPSNEIIIAHVNINYLENKFDMITNSVTEYIDILMISETKLEETFPDALYHLKEFSNLYRL